MGKSNDLCEMYRHFYSLILFNIILNCSHNDRTTQWEDPRSQLAAAALSHGNLFSSSSEHSSVETLFSTPTQIASLGSSQNGIYFISLYLILYHRAILWIV